MLNSDQYEQILNDQEEVIADLRNKLLEMTDSRDLAIGKALELVQSMKRIECRGCECSEIARRAIDDYNGR